MVNTESPVAFPAVPLVVPERVHRGIGMQRADRIEPAWIQKAPSKPAAPALQARSSRRDLVGFNAIGAAAVGYGLDRYRT